MIKLHGIFSSLLATAVLTASTALAEVPGDWTRSDPLSAIYLPTTESSNDRTNQQVVGIVTQAGTHLVTWTMAGDEGDTSQRIAISRSTDDGTTWSAPQIIDADSPTYPGAASYSCLFQVPETGRIYCFYLKNDPSVITVRRDITGWLKWQYSDDDGQTWTRASARFDMGRGDWTPTDPDVPTSWIGIYSPHITSSGDVLFSFARYGLYEDGNTSYSSWMTEVYFLRFDNILTETNPENLTFTVLPETPQGLRILRSTNPDLYWGNEPSWIELSDGCLLTAIRTRSDAVYYAVSSDQGASWTQPAPLRYADGGEIVLNPNAPCPLVKLSDGRLVLMFHNAVQSNTFGPRNPIYVSVGVEDLDSPQPIRLEAPKLFMEVDGVPPLGVTYEQIATYSTLVEHEGELLLYYNDCKHWVLFKHVPDDLYALPTPALLANWAFDSDLTDAIGGRDATAFGDAGLTATAKIGWGAVAFDGEGDYLTAGNASDFVIGTDALSVSFWFQVADADKEAADRFLGTGATADEQSGWAAYMQTGPDRIGAGMSDGTGRILQEGNANGTVDPLDGNWHLAVIVFDPSANTVRTYLNGVIESVIAREDLGGGLTGAVNNAFQLTFGGEPGSPTSKGLHGYLDDVAIWDGALRQNDIDTLWNEGTGTAAISPPEIVTLSPADDAPDVSPGTSLVATFNEPVQAGAGFITLRKTSDDSTVESFDMESSTGLTFSGSQLIINPGSALDLATAYYVEIDPGAVVDSTAIPFAGLSGNAAWNFTTSANPPAVLADINADGTNRTATTTHFEAATGLATGTFDGEPVLAFPNNEPGGGAFSQTVDNITIAVSHITNDADRWFGEGTDNDLLEDGLYYRDAASDPSALITLSGGGLSVAPNRSYELYLFAGRSQGHETTFTFDADDPAAPSGGTAIHTNPPLIGGDNTLGTARFTFETGAVPPASLAIQWDGLKNVDGKQDAIFSGFALRDVGAANTFAGWITDFGLDAGDQGFDDDPDGDGLNNGVEALFGTDPGVSNPGLTEVSKSASTVTFQHPNADTPLSDLSGSYKWSIDLATWYACDGVAGDGSTTVTTVTTVATPDSPAANVTTVEATIGGTVPSRIFLRAVVTTP